MEPLEVLAGILFTVCSTCFVVPFVLFWIMPLPQGTSQELIALLVKKLYWSFWSMMVLSPLAAWGLSEITIASEHGQLAALALPAIVFCVSLATFFGVIRTEYQSQRRENGGW